MRQKLAAARKSALTRVMAAAIAEISIAVSALEHMDNEQNLLEKNFRMYEHWKQLLK
jgi:hypothetical protein